jgi:CRP-like cAMP-binding protein
MDYLKEITNYIDHNDLWIKAIDLERKDFLKTTKTVDTNLYFVVEGSLQIYVEGADQNHIIRLAYQNSFFGAIDSFITEQVSDLYIQAIKKCHLKVISKTVFMQTLNDNPKLEKYWYKLLEALILQQMEREIDLLTASPQERYLRVLERSPQVFQEIPNKYIASYLRMSPETLSRLKKS